MIDQNIRDDMMFFYGNLDALHWSLSNNQTIDPETIQYITDRYKSILTRLFYGTVKDEDTIKQTEKYYAGFGHLER